MEGTEGWWDLRHTSNLPAFQFRRKTSARILRNPVPLKRSDNLRHQTLFEF